MPQILRTPDEQFQNLPDYPFEPHYIDLDGVRMHYIDEGNPNDPPILMLHGEPSWSFLYRHMIPHFSEYRAVAPDLIGFGRSDKFTEQSDYTFSMHAEKLRAFIEALDLTNITVVVQDWGGMLGLNAVREMPDRFSRLVIMNTGLPTGEQQMPESFLKWQKIAASMDDMPVGTIIQNGTVTKLSDEVVAAYDAPFPNASYKAAAHIFPSLVPTSPEQDGATQLKATHEFLSHFEVPVLVMFSDQDPITSGGDRFFRKILPLAKEQPEITIENGGHFLQEDQGDIIAKEILAFLDRVK